MSPKQLKFFYGPAWTRCARANNWHSLRALALPAPEIQSPTGQELRVAVVDAADALARREHRGPRTDDYRHACHVVALGKNKSSLDMTNAEVERVVALFRVLAEPDSIEAVLEWQSPERAKHRNLVKAARHAAPEAYTREILRHRFGGRDVEELSVRELQQLCMTLNNRKEAWRANAEPETETAVGGIECPF
jgi:hypothetical protein